MYLEQIPREDGECKKVVSIDEYANQTLIDVTVTSELLSSVGRFEEWLLAFQEHYEHCIGQKTDYMPYRHIQMRGMKIPKDVQRIDFRVDWGHDALKFRIPEGDEEARDIVYDFLEHIL